MIELVDKLSLLPSEQGDQFFWDFRNPGMFPSVVQGWRSTFFVFFFIFFFPWNEMLPDAAAYYVSSILQTVNSPYIDGTFTDDGM